MAGSKTTVLTRCYRRWVVMCTHCLLQHMQMCVRFLHPSDGLPTTQLSNDRTLGFGSFHIYIFAFGRWFYTKWFTHTRVQILKLVILMLQEVMQLANPPQARSSHFNLLCGVWRPNPCPFKVTVFKSGRGYNVCTSGFPELNWEPLP